MERTDGRAYVYGSAARQADIRRQLDEPRKQLSHTTRKNRERARHMNFAYVLFLCLAMAVTGYVLIGYIRLESGITTSVKKIASLENQVNTLKVENDENLSRIESAVDLEEIRRIAITELGMVYAAQGQIVEIPDEGSDYVRQYTEIQK
ncbi:MAG: cell division protein FtsL [Lachnospiraceae bacterium]|nr:cell division protein FtsL [Lachnospiraceae bacterium]